MQAQEIEPQSWRDFCEKFSALNEGSLMTVELHRFDGRKDEVAQNLPLQRMKFDTTGACNDVISLTFTGGERRNLIHEAIEPIHVRIKQNDQQHKILQIEAENGITLLHFHTGRVPELAPGLKTYKGDRIAMSRNDRRFAIP